MSRGEAEYRALAQAMYTRSPACKNDSRYLAEANELDEPTKAEMRARCRACHVADLCIAYAQSAKPAAGMWGGRYYSADPRARLNGRRSR